MNDINDWYILYFESQFHIIFPWGMAHDYDTIYYIRLVVEIVNNRVRRDGFFLQRFFSNAV